MLPIGLRAKRPCISPDHFGGLSWSVGKMQLYENKRRLGSANGNRTCMTPVQTSPSGAKCLQTRAPGMAADAPKPPRMPDVAPRWHLGGTMLGPGVGRVP